MKKIVSVILVLLVVMSLPITAYAETVEDTLYYYGDGSMTIYVRWDVEQPSVQFTDPRGNVYDPKVEAEGTGAAVMGNTLYYYIESPAKGTWRYTYEKGNNTSVEVGIVSNADPLTVESFTIDQVSGDYLPATFRVSGAEYQGFYYRISAVADGVTGEKALTTGYAYANREENISVYLGSLTSYNNYKLKLYVYYMDNGVEVFDSAYSAAFAYTNPDADWYAPDFAVTIRPDEYLLTVQWNQYWNCDSVLIAVIEDGGEPSYDTYEPYIGNIQLSYAPSTKVVEVEMTAKVDGVSTTPVRKTMNVANMGIACPSEKAVNYVNYPITYTNVDVTATMTVNGETKEQKFSGTGILNVQLQDDWNELSLTYTDANGVNWQLNRKVYVDRVAPVLKMSQTYDGMAVQGNKLIISGSVTDGTAVSVNGEAVTLSADGLFSKEVTLAEGENIVSVVATDGLGNESRYSAKVYSGEIPGSAGKQNGQGGSTGRFAEKLLDSYWPLVISSFVAVLVIAYGLIFWRKEKKKDETV